MVQLLDFYLPTSETLKGLGPLGPEEIPALDITMPRVFRQPAAKGWARGRLSVVKLINQAARAYHSADHPALAAAYGKLTAEFLPAIRWALNSWEFLLSTEGIRFLSRPEEQKRYCRGDYRAFLESDYHGFVYRSFKRCLLGYLTQKTAGPFSLYLKKHFWPEIRSTYQALENPPDRKQRRLTDYSYLRCVPYQFINGYHHERVYTRVRQLSKQEQQVIQLYYLNFYTEEAILSHASLNSPQLRNRQACALKRLAHQDFLTYRLLLQIEQY
jgi:hypothetical protein